MFRHEELAGVLRHAALHEPDTQQGGGAVVQSLDVPIRLVVVLRFRKAGVADLLLHGDGFDFGVVPELSGRVVGQAGELRVPGPLRGQHRGEHVVLHGGDEGGDRGEHGGGQDDADDGDDGARAVATQGFHGDPVEDVHTRVTSSRAMRPSSMLRIRSACSAIFSSWVMTMRVWLYFLL